MKISRHVVLLILLMSSVVYAQEPVEGSFLIINEQGYYDLEIIARQFNYTLVDLSLMTEFLEQGQDPESARLQSTLHNTLLDLEPGRTIRITAKSADIQHGLLIDELNIEFVLEPPAEEELYGLEQMKIIDLPSVDITIRGFCHVFCGTGHSEMQFTLQVGEGLEYGGRTIDVLGDWRVWVLLGLFASGTGFIMFLTVSKPPDFLQRLIKR